MVKYILKRLLNSVIVILISGSIIFFATKAMPSGLVDPKLPPEVRLQIETAYGLHDPLPVQYLNYLKSVVTFDFKTSINIQKNRAVSEIIAQKLPISIMLGVVAAIFGILVGTLLGIIAAIRRGKFMDHFVTILAVLGVSVPSIVIAILLQYFFAVYLHWFPVTFNGSIMSSILPILALSLWPIASISRYTRTELIEVMNSEYILLAEAKGVSRKNIIIKHALRNALIPVITVCGPLIVSVIIGGLVVESVFGIAGFGGLLLQATQLSDYPVILGVAFVLSVIFTLTYLIIDLLYGVIDPRIRLAGREK